MPIDFNRHTFPKQGWTFVQPQTRWTNPMAMVGFDASVKAIIEHRRANKAITAKHRLSTDYDTVADELEAYTKARLGIPMAGPPSFFQWGRSNQAKKEEVAAATNKWLRKISRLKTGVKTLRNWLGEGGVPVAKELSDQRSSVCSVCPKNIAGDWLSMFVKPVSKILMAQIEDRNNMRLSTPNDDRIGLCDACGCPLKLKVHVPVDVIRRHMEAPEKEKLDPGCWILSEP